VRLTRYRFKEDGMKFESLSSDATPNHTIKQSFRGNPLEGRGRGRGRRKSPLGSSSLEAPLNSTVSLHTHASAAFEGQMDDSKTKQPSLKSNQLRRENNITSELSQYFLRSRQVPAYKEGECEKLVTLRQRLLSRRQIRLGKENASTEHALARGVRKSDKSQYDKRIDAGKGNTSEGISCSLEQLDRNDCSAISVQRKPNKINNVAINSSSRLPIHQLEDGHSNYQDASIDKMPFSYSQTKRGEEDIDDQASVVDIKLLKCDYCKRSFAPKVYEKHFDCDGQPKCVGILDKKRQMFDSAKARITNNSNLKSGEQDQVLQASKNATKELSKNLRRKSSRKTSKRGSKWKQESENFREAMKSNRLISKAEREGKPSHYYL